MAKVVRLQCGDSGWVDLPAECAALLNQGNGVHLKWCTGKEEKIGKGEDCASSPCVILRGHVLETSSDLLHVSADGLFARLPFHAGDSSLPFPGDAIRVHVFPVSPSVVSEDGKPGHQNRRLRRRV